MTITDPPTPSRRRWSCLSCAWSSTRIPAHVVVVFHKCKSDGIRRKLVELPSLVDDDLETRRFDDRTRWFESRYPVPPPPVAARDPRPAAPPRPTESPR